MEPTSYHETSVTTNQHCITTLRAKDLIYTEAEAWNQTSLILSKARHWTQLGAVYYSEAQLVYILLICDNSVPTQKFVIFPKKL
jgi:hypothetical protein